MPSPTASQLPRVADLPRLPSALGTRDAGFGELAFFALLGLVLVEHRLGGGVTLGAKLVAVVAAPLVRRRAASVELGEMRHHIARIELVGALRRLEIGPVMGLLQERAERALLV